MNRKHLAGYSALAVSLVAVATLTLAAPAESASRISPPIPVTGLGATAGAQYHDDGLSVTATPAGARLRCVFQKLEGQVTREGLWLTSTTENSSGERFRVVASKVGRVAPCAPLAVGGASVPASRLVSSLAPPDSGQRTTRPTVALPETGLVTVADQRARFIRPGVTEEYSVSVDGVRQDFVVTQRPAGHGVLRVELDVTGAQAEALANGARLVLDGSGRKIAYTRLHVVDAAGKELTARMEVVSGILPDVEGVHPAARNSPATFPTLSLPDAVESAGLEAPALRQAGTPTATRLAVLVDDAAAKYPVRIDPTFSDEDWISLGSGVSGYYVRALAVSGSNLYVGGSFTNAGGISTIGVAKWDGSAWSALGSGMSGSVYALAVLGDDLYAQGKFFTAGGSNANRIAKWNGTTWSPLGSGLSGGIAGWYALAVSGSNLYVGGYFTTAGGSNANGVAKWNGSEWSALGTGVGSGMNAYVTALAVSGSDLYVGGGFTMAGGNSANRVAKWNGSTWSALGGGLNNVVWALAVSGSNLYVGGNFTTATNTGGVTVTANGVAKWDGTAWSALGSGVGNAVEALAMSGSDLYVGGNFTTAGGKLVNGVAKVMGPASFASIAPNPSGTEALLTYSTAPGASLHLLSSPDLITWQTNTTVTATDVTNSVSINLTQPQEFFRLRRLP